MAVYYISQAFQALRGSLFTNDLANLCHTIFVADFKITTVEHPPIRALNEEHAFISNWLSTNPFYFILAATTQEIKADAITIGLNNLAQARSQLGILRCAQVALKHAVLHPLAIRFKDLVNLGSSFIFRNIVTDDNVHSRNLFQYQRWIFLGLTHQVFRYQPCLNLKSFLVATLCLQNGVLKL